MQMGDIDKEKELARYTKMFEQNNIRYTVIHHPVRIKFGLTNSEYCVLDSVDQLSNTEKYPFCIRKQEAIGEFIGVTRQTVSRACSKGVKQGLLEKNDRGEYRTTLKWITTVKLYDPRDPKN